VNASPWLLEENTTFLNHGSFGSCPRPVLAAQDELRQRMEAEPVRFMVRELPGLLHAARVALAEVVCAEPANLAFVRNATTGVNAVLRSRQFEPGDELLVTDHEYNACRNALDYVANRSGACVVVAPLPFPLRGAEQVLEAILGRTTARTRLVLVDHVTSQTAMVLPVRELALELRERGIDLLVDGAHAPGMLPLTLEAMGASWYTGNCHKWLCAPKGTALLWARADRQADLMPTTISHGYNRAGLSDTRFHDLFDWTGTDDPTSFLALPAAIEFLAALHPGGLMELRQRNHRLALQARDILCEALQVPPPVPDSMLGSMAAVPLPDGAAGPGGSPLYEDPLQDRLIADHRIQVPVIPWPAPPKRLIRISAQDYNSPAQYRKLAQALPAALAAESRASV